MCTRSRRRLLVALLSCAALLTALAPPAEGALAGPLLPPIADNGGRGFLLSDDGALAVYASDAPGSAGQIFSVPVSGQAPPAVVVSTPYLDVSLLALAGGRVLFAAASQASPARALLSAPLDGSAAPAVLATGFIDFYHGGRTAVGGGRAIFVVEREVSGEEVVQLCSAPLDGSGPLTVLAEAASYLWIGWSVAPGSPARVIYTINAPAAGMSLLFSVPAAGPAAARVQLSPTGQTYTSFVVSDDGTTVVFRVNQRLYAIPADGSKPARLVSQEPAAGDDLCSFAVSPDGGVVTYVVVRLAGAIRAGAPAMTSPYPDPAQLYSAPTDGSGPPVRLNERPIDLLSIYKDFIRITMSPDLKTALYEGDALGGPVIATLGERGSAWQLAEPESLGDSHYLDAQRIVVAARGGISVVPIDPAGAPTRLTPPDLNISSARSAGDRIVFTGCFAPCAPADGRTLFSVPQAGPQAAIARLALWQGESVDTRYALTAAGRVVYAAHADDRPGTRLYSLPIDPVGVGFLAASALVLEGDPGQVAVALDRASAVPVTVGYSVEGLGATRAGALSFAPGVLTQTIDLGLSADGVFTGDRAVGLRLTDPAGAALLLYDRHALTIRDAEALHIFLPTQGKSGPYP